MTTRWEGIRTPALPRPPTVIAPVPFLGVHAGALTNLEPKSKKETPVLPCKSWVANSQLVTLPSVA
jgi:hypothetical protein